MTSVEATNGNSDTSMEDLCDEMSASNLSELSCEDWLQLIVGDKIKEDDNSETTIRPLDRCKQAPVFQDVGDCLNFVVNNPAHARALKARLARNSESDNQVPVLALGAFKKAHLALVTRALCCLLNPLGSLN